MSGRLHPVTGLAFDLEHVCATCEFFSKRTRLKVKTYSCAQAPEMEGKTIPGESRSALPACVKWKRKS